MIKVKGNCCCCSGHGHKAKNCKKREISIKHHKQKPKTQFYKANMVKGTDSLGKDKTSDKNSHHKPKEQKNKKGKKGELFIT